MRYGTVKQARRKLHIEAVMTKMLRWHFVFAGTARCGVHFATV